MCILHTVIDWWEPPLKVPSGDGESYPVNEILERSFGIEWKDGDEDRFGRFAERRTCCRDGTVDEIHVQNRIDVTKRRVWYENGQTITTGSTLGNIGTIPVSPSISFDGGLYTQRLHGHLHAECMNTAILPRQRWKGLENRLRVLQGREEIDEGVARSVRVAGGHLAAISCRAAQWNDSQEPLRLESGVSNHEPLLVDPGTWKRGPVQSSVYNGNVINSPQCRVYTRCAFHIFDAHILWTMQRVRCQEICQQRRIIETEMLEIERLGDGKSHFVVTISLNWIEAMPYDFVVPNPMANGGKQQFKERARMYIKQFRQRYDARRPGNKSNRVECNRRKNSLA